ncbi:hypothetical protein V1514DRAFT_325217 [Lipomyces japonicus]|uniref:uncharacterized protein n=1 Tax=Lipomyces japonicus TaxID=56871 RepID=UPI0034CFE40F
MSFLSRVVDKISDTLSIPHVSLQSSPSPSFAPPPPNVLGFAISQPHDPAVQRSSQVSLRAGKPSHDRQQDMQDRPFSPSATTWFMKSLVPSFATEYAREMCPVQADIGFEPVPDLTCIHDDDYSAEPEQFQHHDRNQPGKKSFNSNHDKNDDDDDDDDDVIAINPILRQYIRIRQRLSNLAQFCNHGSISTTEIINSDYSDDDYDDDNDDDDRINLLTRLKKLEKQVYFDSPFVSTDLTINKLDRYADYVQKRRILLNLQKLAPDEQIFNRIETELELEWHVFRTWVLRESMEIEWNKHKVMPSFTRAHNFV